MKLPRPRSPRVVVSFNGKVGRGGKAMCHSIRGIVEDNPTTDVILLQESGGYVDDLRNTFWRDWKVYAKAGWDESANCPVMVRRLGFAPRIRYQKGWGTVRCKVDWIGPHGQHHPGRTWTWVKVGGVYVLSLHRVWGGDRERNQRAYQEEANKLTAFFAAHTEHPVVVFGDTNTGMHEDWPGSMREIREAVHGKFVADTDEPGIDYAVVKRVAAQVKRTQEYGSDHRAAVMSKIEPR